MGRIAHLFLDEKRVNLFLQIGEGKSVESAIRDAQTSRAGGYKFVQEFLDNDLLKKFNKKYFLTDSGKELFEALKSAISVIEKAEKQRVKADILKSPFTREELRNILKEVEEEKKK